ncbi:hypothetical protein SCP_1502390 [Sparassis crispa]|uniref:Uncharacterized protein n=1 Tax=Sparassis crispa TaxID=139825 RepID=A0A401H4A6_9APHY|nr:hypothetical protein SCP_1502390 [Sparassis crispa]GBE89231.1 hypothetical protein SCP_1502390 [Sparassis crispa]
MSSPVSCTGLEEALDEHVSSYDLEDDVTGEAEAHGPLPWSVIKLVPLEEAEDESEQSVANGGASPFNGGITTASYGATATNGSVAGGNGDRPGNSPGWSAVLDAASRGVSDGTDKEYRRLMHMFSHWVHQLKLVSDNYDVFGNTISEKTPEWISMWILSA